MSPTDPNYPARDYSAPTRLVSPSGSATVYTGGGAAPQLDPLRPVLPRLRMISLSAVARSLWASLKFLAETEVHVYSFAVSVNVLISFYPFIVAMILVCKHVLQWPAAASVIIQTVRDYFPSDFGLDMAGFLQKSSHQRFSLLSILLLFFTANGIFTPLEVAFNRIWAAKGNRNFVSNQVISLALIFICGILVLGSACLDTLNTQFFGATLGTSEFSKIAQSLVLHLIALPVTVVMIFLIYWLLPNAKISIGRLLPSSIAVAVLIQVAEFVNVLLWPWLRDKLRTDVPPFVQSISIIFWAFIATMILLAGAEWAAREKPETHFHSHDITVPDLS